MKYVVVSCVRSQQSWAEIETDGVFLDQESAERFMRANAERDPDRSWAVSVLHETRPTPAAGEQ